VTLPPTGCLHAPSAILMCSDRHRGASRGSTCAELISATGTGLGATLAPASEPVNDLVRRLRSPDEQINGPACQAAVAYGAPAVRPLLALLAEPDFELSRRAKRALYAMVRYAGRPGANNEARDLEIELLGGLSTGTNASRRHVLWLFSEIGSARAVPSISALLSVAELREDARCALMRIPGRRSTRALRAAFAAAPEDFKYALADSLRQRGEKVDGYPSQKRLPTRQTTVTPSLGKAK